ERSSRPKRRSPRSCVAATAGGFNWISLRATRAFRPATASRLPSASAPANGSFEKRNRLCRAEMLTHGPDEIDAAGEGRRLERERVCLPAIERALVQQ